MLALSPFALRLMKASFHAEEDGMGGIQQLAHDANLLFYASDEAKEGREAYKAKRTPDFGQFPKTAVSPLHIWLMAARPRTLPAAAAPVLVGTAYAATLGTFKPLTFVATLLGALFIQIGTNLSNDYSDARRGADTEDRLGPVRVTAGGLVPPKQVLIATYVAFGLAVAVGVYLIATAGWELLLVGVASILAGVLYTGGPRPYGYEGLGEVFVFLFFGLVAVTGTFFAQMEELNWESFVLAVPVGLLATAILMVNNIRDLETDRRAGKKTLAVRLGRPRARDRLRARRLPRVRHRAPRLGVRRRAPDAVAAAPVAGAADRGADRPDRPQPRRRPVAQRRARPHRHAPTRLLRPAVRGSPPLTVIGLSVRSERFPMRIKASWGELSEREVLIVRLDHPDGTWGEGEAAPLEPYDGVSMAEVRAALDAYAADAQDDRADRRRARGLPRRTRPPPGARRDRPRALGPRVSPDADPAQHADRPARRRLRAGQRDDQRRRPRRCRVRGLRSAQDRASGA